MSPFRSSMSPYRSTPQQNLCEAPKEGIVADMIRQFADPYAFVRELVQNSIDAGASQIRVELSLRLDGAACSSVCDNGSGMTLDLIEGPLLTLFSSSKEGAIDKIGKYGVGFMSIFALGPEQVIIETWRPDAGYLITLERNLDYVVHTLEPRQGSGTRVEQVLPAMGDRYQEHVQQIEASLLRWCRHALCPIIFSASDQDGKTVRSEQRIDTPLSVPCAVSVTERTDNDVIVVGYNAGATFRSGAEGIFAGFYNRGLTLFESTSERFHGLDGLQFKVMSPSLRHTLSRDNVRRDEAFESLLSQVKRLADHELLEELRKRMEGSARECAIRGSCDDYRAVLMAAAIHLDRLQIVLPLIEAVDGQWTMTVAQVLAHRTNDEPCLSATAAGELTNALSRAGKPVVRNLPIPHDLLQPTQVVDAASYYALFTVVPVANDAERLLLTTVESALRAAGAAVSAVSFCTVIGAIPQSCSIVIPAEQENLLLGSCTQIAAWRDDWGANRRAVLLRAGSQAVDLALASVRPGDVEQMAFLLARIVLLECRGAIDAHANDALLDLALGRVLAKQVEA